MKSDLFCRLAMVQRPAVIRMVNCREQAEALFQDPSYRRAFIEVNPPVGLHLEKPYRVLRCISGHKRILGRRRVFDAQTTEVHSQSWKAFSTRIEAIRKALGHDTPTPVIGLKLGRTVAAVYSKASEEEISLMPPNPHHKRK